MWIRGWSAGWRALCATVLVSGHGIVNADSPVRIQFDVRTPMRDGVELSSDIWLPQKVGRYPVLLVRTPYGKAGAATDPISFAPIAQFFAEHGYVFVMQDVRGRGDSDGKFGFFFAEGRDGYDTVEWLAKQPWSNGKIGMLGVSYLATAQWLAAREHPPHLICISPTAPAGRYFYELPYSGGAFNVDWSINWLNLTSGHLEQGANAASLKMDAILKHRPLLTLDEAFGRHMPLYRDFLTHSTLDDYWKRIQFAPEDFKDINIPALTITGWFDGDQPGALYYWRNMRAYSPAKNNQYLLAGPWTHVQAFVGGERKLGGFEFSADSVYDLRSLQLAFFDHFLKGSAPKFDFPPVHIYVTGSNKWRDDQEYPPRTVRSRALYLHSRGRANTLNGDGALSWTAPTGESPDHFTYAPDNPVADPDQQPGGDQRYLEKRDDVLVYSSETLSRKVEVIGNVVLHLYAASDARDTDFTARILDVYPDGRALLLGPRSVSILRARYRHGMDHTELLTPGKTEHYQIELFDIAHAFLPQHKLRVEISSSYTPDYSPNPNTGNPIATDTQSRPALQTIFHDAKAASYLALPVMPD